MNTTLIAPMLALALLAGAPSARAALDEPLVFDQAGWVTLTLDVSSGGFDHLLDLVPMPGTADHPLMVLTDSADPSADVLGWVPAMVGDSVLLGPVAAGQEIVLRITNVESARLGTPGTIGGQVFTGSAAGFNADPSLAYSFVETLSPTQKVVRIEDLFGVDPGTGTLDDWDLQFTLTLAPVPEPGVGLMMLAGLACMVFARRRRA